MCESVLRYLGQSCSPTPNEDILGKVLHVCGRPGYLGQVKPNPTSNSNRRPNHPQRKPKSAPDRPHIGPTSSPKWPRIDPDRPQNGCPNRPHIDPQSAQVRPELGSKSSPNWPRIDPKLVPNRPKVGLLGGAGGVRRSWGVPGASWGGLGGILGAPSWRDLGP